MQIMRYSRWGYDGEINAKARESGDLRPAKPPDWHEWSGIPDPSNTSRPQTKGSMGSMNSFRTTRARSLPWLIEDEDSQTTWLEDDGSALRPSTMWDVNLFIYLFLHTRPLVAVLFRRNTTGGLERPIERRPSFSASSPSAAASRLAAITEASPSARLRPGALALSRSAMASRPSPRALPAGDRPSPFRLLGSALAASNILHLLHVLDDVQRRVAVLVAAIQVHAGPRDQKPQQLMVAV